MQPSSSPDTQHKIWTIPNLLSFLRLVLIPVIVWLYVGEKNYPAAAVVLVISFLSDLADGFIARHFHMTSDLGTALDPIADKLTQGVLLICLASRFPWMWVPVALMVVKEAYSGFSRLKLLRRGQIYGAAWHGKISTALLDVLVVLHVLWYNIPAGISNPSIGICTAFMLFSFILYVIQIRKLLHV